MEDRSYFLDGNSHFSILSTSASMASTRLDVSSLNFLSEFAQSSEPESGSAGVPPWVMLGLEPAISLETVIA